MPPLVLSTNDSVETNNGVLSDAPAVWITGDRIRFINSESGRAITTTAGVPAIRMDGADGVVINQAGGIIRSAIAGGTPLVIQGSAGNDRVENAGTLTGLVSLGEGSDTFISRGGASEFQTVVDLGGGDDFYYLRGLSSFSQSTYVDGGAGVDRYVIFEADGNVDGPSANNFEILDLRVNGYVESFHGLETIVVDFRAAGRTFNALRFFNTPDAEIQILTAGNSGSLSVYDRSAIGGVTGSDLSDSLDLGNDTLVSGTIDLGAGDDYLTLRRSQFENPQQVLIGEEIDGGSGTDNFSIYLQGGDVFDAANVVNFEKMRVSTFVGAGTPFILRNVDMPLELTISQATTVRLEGSDLTGGSIIVEPTASLTINAGSIVGMVTSFVPFPIDTVVSDDTKSISIVNQGQILGDVRMYIGDDLLDSRTGTVAGHVLGYAGNDTILTDAGDNWLDGGAGADILSAGIGNDSLFGGSANDSLDGGAGADDLYGGAGSDYYVVDNLSDRVFEAAGEGYDIVFTKSSFALAAGQEVESLGVLNESSTNLLDLAGNGFSNRIIGNDASNGFTGGGGADLFYGNGGNDFYVVDSADDRVIETAGDGYDIVFVTGPGFTLSTGSEVESIGAYDQAGTGAMSLNGNELDNRMAGNNGSNSFDGGAGADLMYGSLGNDYYVVDNALDRPIEKVGEGYDIVFAKSSYALEAGQEIESLGTLNPSSTASIDLSGNEFANLIVGNAGANTVNGGGGADILYGEGGADIFAFTTAPGGGNADRMADFVSGTDKIALDDAVFSALAPGALNPGAFVIGSAPADADDRIIYNSSSGFLLYDADGSGAGGAVLFATVAPGTIISASDFLVI